MGAVIGKGYLQCSLTNRSFVGELSLLGDWSVVMEAYSVALALFLPRESLFCMWIDGSNRSIEKVGKVVGWLER